MRSRIEITEAVLLLLLWKWANISSIAMFSRSPWEHSQAPDKMSSTIHLCAIRYLMLVRNKLVDKDSRVGDFRTHIQN